MESKDRVGTGLPEAQVRLAKAVIAANPRTAVVVNVGHAFDAGFAERAAALIVAWYPGEGFGDALAAVLTGDIEPSGRLPVTLARADGDYPAFSLTPLHGGELPYAEGCLVGYRSFMQRRVAPLHAFGAGLGFGRFRFHTAWCEGDDVVVSISNDGAMTASEVVQLYRRSPEPALVGFAKATLAPGERRDVRVTVEPRSMRTWSAGWHRPDGPVVIDVGRASDDLRLAVELNPEAVLGA